MREAKVAQKATNGPVTDTVAQMNLADFLAHMSRETPVTSHQHMLGYARVSTTDQNNQRQIDELIAFGVDPSDIWTDTASGRNMHRPGWESCWRDIRRGDLLVIYSIDRLGRDLVEVVQTVKALHEKGANLKVLSMDIDTRTPTGMLMFVFVAAMAEWERKLMLERTKHGLQKARDRGVIGGKRSKWTDEEVMAAIAEYGLNGAARHLDLSKTQVIRRRNGYLAKQEMAITAAQEQPA
jgi:DNA invertase Pin-like site-specific DNA recombinase